MMKMKIIIILLLNKMHRISKQLRKWKKVMKFLNNNAKKILKKMKKIKNQCHNNKQLIYNNLMHQRKSLKDIPLSLKDYLV